MNDNERGSAEPMPKKTLPQPSTFQVQAIINKHQKKLASRVSGIDEDYEDSEVDD